MLAEASGPAISSIPALLARLVPSTPSSRAGLKCSPFWLLGLPQRTSMPPMSLGDDLRAETVIPTALIPSATPSTNVYHAHEHHHLVDTILGVLAWWFVAEAAKARSTGFPAELGKPAHLYCTYARRDTINQRSPLACRELLSPCRGALANHRRALHVPHCPGWYRGSQNSWLPAARGGSHMWTCCLAMTSLCAASLIVVDGYSTLLLALLRPNVVIPRRAAAGPHCRTADAAKRHLRCK